MAPQQRLAEIRKLQNVLATTRPTGARQTILKRLWRLNCEANADTQSV